MSEQEYAGFWVRVGAAIIDTILVSSILVPILTTIYGVGYWSDLVGFFQYGLAYKPELAVDRGVVDSLLNYVLPAFAIIIFWIYKSATPGKMILKLSIVDAETGEKPSTGQFIGRYLGYYVSMLPLFMGIIWVGIDKRKQGWHDKLAGTVVIRVRQE